MGEMSSWLFLPTWDCWTANTRVHGLPEPVFPGTAVCQAMPAREQLVSCPWGVKEAESKAVQLSP